MNIENLIPSCDIIKDYNIFIKTQNFVAGNRYQKLSTGHTVSFNRTGGPQKFGIGLVASREPTLYDRFPPPGLMLLSLYTLLPFL